MAFEKLIKRRAVERQKWKIRSERSKSLLLERGITIFKQFGVRMVIVFGSVGDGVCGEISDIDILAMPLKNSQYWDFRHELEEAVDLPIDLYTDLDDPILVEKKFRVENKFMRYDVELLKVDILKELDNI